MRATTGIIGEKTMTFTQLTGAVNGLARALTSPLDQGLMDLVNLTLYPIVAVFGLGTTVVNE